MKRIFFGSLFAFFLALAGSAEDRGYEIAKKSDSLKVPVTRTMKGTMQIQDQSGASRVRKMTMHVKKTPEGEQSFIEIHEPADVAGTKFLSVPLENGESDQRLYLPALKKVRKIASGGKSGEFINSDFSFYDLEEHPFDDFTYSLLSEGDVLGDPAFRRMKFFRVESRPKKSTAPYSKAILWINMEDYFTYRTETYDKSDDSLWKIISVTKVEAIKDMLIATQTVLENRKKGGRTTLLASGISVDEPLPRDVFSVKGLEK
jgi:hypothetical protein